METPLRTNGHRFLVDTSALFVLADSLDSIDSPLIIPAVYQELLVSSRMDVQGSHVRERRFGKEAAKKVLRYYEQHPEQILQQYDEPALRSLTRLTGKQIAYDLGRGFIFKPENLAGKGLSGFGRMIGTELVKRVNDMSIPIDERIANCIQTIAFEGQNHVRDRAREHGGRIREPKFDVDLLVVGTARQSPEFSGYQVYVISQDADIKHIMWFSHIPRDRRILCRNAYFMLDALRRPQSF